MRLISPWDDVRSRPAASQPQRRPCLTKIAICRILFSSSYIVGEHSEFLDSDQRSFALLTCVALQNLLEMAWHSTCAARSKTWMTAPSISSPFRPSATTRCSTSERSRSYHARREAQGYKVAGRIARDRRWICFCEMWLVRIQAFSMHIYLFIYHLSSLY